MMVVFSRAADGLITEEVWLVDQAAQAQAAFSQSG